MTNQQPIEFEGRREPAGFHGWLRRYTLRMEAAQLAENTVLSYSSAIRMFSAYLAPLGVDDPTQVRPSHVELYFSRMARDGRQAGAKARFRQLRPFFRWLAGQAGCQDPFEGLGEPKGVQAETQTLEPEQVQRILTYVGQTELITCRNRAMVRLMVDTGVRVTELTSIGRRDVDRPARTIAIVASKGGRHRSVPYGHKTSEALARWLRHRPDNTMSRVHDRLFTASNGAPMDRTDVREMVDRMALRVGLMGVTPHVFRHTFAHLALLNGMAELDVMRIGGWSKLGMLQRYGSMLAERRAQSAHEQYGPGEGI